MKINIKCGQYKYEINVEGDITFLRNGDIEVLGTKVDITQTRIPVESPISLGYEVVDYKTKGQEIKGLREKYSLTQAKLAAKIPGYTDKMISNFETGRQQVPYWLVPHLIKILEEEARPKKSKVNRDQLLLTQREINRAVKKLKK